MTFLWSMSQDSVCCVHCAALCRCQWV